MNDPHVPSAWRRALALDWIGMRRVTAYAQILLLVSVVSYVFSYRQAVGSVGSDFLAFWSAGKLAVTGAAAKVYDLGATGAIQTALGRNEVFAFVNPPPMLLFVAPFGALPYPVAWALWIGLTFLAWFAATRSFAPRMPWALAAFPGALVAGWHAQSGLLTGAFLAGAGRLLRERPFAAGLCVGALAIKPHLAVLMPVALLAGRHWRAIAGAAVAAAGLFAFTALVFGIGVLAAYPKSWAVSRYLMQADDAAFFLRQVTLYAALRVATTPLVAALVQGCATLLAAGLVWRVWSGAAALEGKVAFLLAVAPLATPYLFSYDLPFLAVPVFWLIGKRSGPGASLLERPKLLFFYASPLFCRALALPLGANLAPWVQIWMAWEVWRELHKPR